ncbi:SusC/RagA family TonB-linked outer membrane protein [Flaviaesturariibacter aridisoli]|uniref:SusC/RagA family TonB-linked outer membrane protein n=1 Tax=Flaviaesturariibacter aridisoli TaxID=2545761 RepID=A0A4R4DVZ0_9BACT|nr:SusC/RagA family TonB-linked outer membrane protein [Flaviaesturariibacter aridisoli]TCZ66528.1 SusC/RagA family TonB-linked outer membrane protein [Flaviaesturariibacter aridisoli]
MKKFTSLLCGVLVTASVWAQERLIRGQVTDGSGAALSGVNVSVNGRAVGQTDASGNFSVKAAPGTTLVFSYVGVGPKEVTVGSSDNISVSLATPPKEMSEVVVTAIGQSRSRNKLGYTAQTFNSEAINRTAPVNVLDGLQGRIAGADISTTGGQPGSSVKVVLRGYGNLSDQNQPLYVIDGVPMSDSRLGSSVVEGLDFGNGLNDLNPADVENITVLKGTAAASLYGSQAKNGAIMITTRRGKAGKLRVGLSSAYTLSQVGMLPTMQSSFGQGWDALFWSPENGSWGPRLDGRDRLWGAVVNNSQLLKPFSFVENNIRDFYENGQEWNNTVSLSGGSDVLNFYLSYGNLNANGPLPSKADLLNRNTFSLRTNSRFNRLTIGTSFNYVNKLQNAVATQAESGVSAGMFEELLQIPVDIRIKDFADYHNQFFNVDNYFTPYAENPYFLLRENGSKQRSDRFYGNIDLGYKLTSWLSAQARLGGDFSNAGTFIWKARSEPSPGSWNDGGNTEGQQRSPNVGSVQQVNSYSGLINGDFILKAARDLGARLSLEALAGYNYNQQTARANASRIQDLVIPGFYQLSNSLNSPTATAAETRKRTMGVYAQTVLGYADQLFLTLNARNDWSSALPIERNSFFYPGANLSWVASRTFDLTRTPLSLLKLRAGYGKTGSDANPYLVYSTLVQGNVGLGFGNILFPFNGVPGFEVSNQIGNATLKPVITNELEAGAEIRLFQNRLGIDATYYVKKTEGQILGVPISPSSGFTALISNIGTVTNKGIELTLDGTPVRSKNFTWNIQYTFTRNRSNVDDLGVGLDKINLNAAYDADFNIRPGYPVGIFEAPVARYTDDGRIIVNASTGYPEVAADKGIYGSSQRDYSMGLSNTFTYKDLSLGFGLDFRKGGLFYSGTADLLNFTGNAFNTTYNDRKPFIVPNSVNEVIDPASGKATYVENTTYISSANYDDYFYTNSGKAIAYNNRLLDKSFLKLKDVTLSYRLPRTLATKIHAENLSLSVFAKNLMLWTPKANRYIDPEASNFGNDLSSEMGEFRTGPTLRQFGVRLSANF